MRDTSQPTRPRVRVVVLNWNAWWFTRRCLRALSDTTYPADRLQVVLVDNASVDGSLERLRHEFPDVAVVHNEANLGFAEGCNRAMRDLDGIDMVALVNNDAVVEPGWLLAMVDSLDQHPRAGAAAARLVLDPPFVKVHIAVEDGPAEVRSVQVDGMDATSRTMFSGSVRTEGRTEWPMELVHHLLGPAELMVPVGEGEHRVAITVAGQVGLRATVHTAREHSRADSDAVAARAAAGVTTASVVVGAAVPRVELLNGLGTGRNEVGESYDRHFGEPNDPDAVPELAGPPREVAGFSGGGVLLRADMLAATGLFDPRYFAYYEDSDLSWRAARAGWATVTAPAAVIRHAFGGSGGARAPGFFFLNYRNWLLTVLRNAEPDQRRRTLDSARERLRRAVRSNVASPVRHRRAPSWALVNAWLRTFAGVVAVRVATSAGVRRGAGSPVGARRADRVRSPLQPVFAPRPPAARPGGPALVRLDVTGEISGGGGAGRRSGGEGGRRGLGPAAALLTALSDGTDRLDVVPTVQRRPGEWRRATPAEVGRLLDVAGPHQPVDDDESALDPPSPGTVLVGPTGEGRLLVSTVGGRTEPVVVAADPHAVEAALAPSGPTDRVHRGGRDHSE